MLHDLLHFLWYRVENDTDRSEKGQIENTLCPINHLLVSGSKYNSAVLKSGDKSYRLHIDAADSFK